MTFTTSLDAYRNLIPSVLGFVKSVGEYSCKVVLADDDAAVEEFEWTVGFLEIDVCCRFKCLQIINNRKKRAVLVRNLAWTSKKVYICTEIYLSTQYFISCGRQYSI